MGRAKTFVAMGQLNLYLPQWQIEELERLAQLNKTTRSKYAHKLIASHLTPPQQSENVKPVLEKDSEWETAIDIEPNEILKF